MRSLAPLLVVAGCVWTPPGVVHRPPAPEPVVETLLPAQRITIRDAATRYGEITADAPATPTAAAALEAMRVFAGDRGKIMRDPRLDRVAEDLADAGTATAITTDLVLRARGVVEPAHQIWWVRDTGDLLGALVRQLDNSLYAANVRVGVGVSHDGHTLVAVVIHAAGVALDGVPRSLPANASAPLLATLGPRFHDPVVRITQSDGSVTHGEITPRGAQFLTTITCGDKGDLWIDITAHDEAGTPHALAAFPIACGTTPPSELVHEPAQNLAGLADAARVESRLASIVNRERKERGLALLTIDDRIARVAHDHAVELSRDHRASHRSRDGQSIDSRLRSAGIDAPSVSESLLVADDLGSAVDALLGNPAYRAAYAPEMTSIGVGYARDPEGEVTLALMYMRVVPRLDERAIARALTDGLYEAGKLDDLRISPHPELMRLADDMAHGLSVGWRRDTLWRFIGAQVNRLNLAGYESAVITFYDPSELDAKTILGKRTFETIHHLQPLKVNAVGVGIAQSARDGYFGGKCWAVVFFAKR